MGGHRQEFDKHFRVSSTIPTTATFKIWQSKKNYLMYSAVLFCGVSYLQLLVALCGIFLLTISSHAATFFVEDSTATVTNTSINPSGLISGDTVNFQGVIKVPDNTRGVFLSPIPSNLMITVDSGATINSNAGFSANSDAFLINGDFDGTFSNAGNIVAGNTGIEFSNDLNGGHLNSGTINGFMRSLFIGGSVNGSINNTGTLMNQTGSQSIFITFNLSGSLINSGTISGGGSGISINVDLNGFLNNSGIINGIGNNGVSVNNSLNKLLTNTGSITGGVTGIQANFQSGTISNSGLIRGGTHGIRIENNFTGTIKNSGSIESNLFGILIVGNGTGVIMNHGGAIKAESTNPGSRSISLGNGNGTVVLSGPSYIIGIMDGGAGASDSLKFSNMRGISKAKQAELVELATADSTALTSVKLFGSEISWVNFEDIQANLNSLQSYEELITVDGLSGFAHALDNVLSLESDEFREFLTILNDAETGLLNEIARNSSGQIYMAGINDYVQSQDVALFGQLMHHLNNARHNTNGAHTGSFSLLKDFDNHALQGIYNNLIALDTNGTSDVSTLERQSIQPSKPQTPQKNWNTFISGYGGVEYQDTTKQRARRSAHNAAIIAGGGSWLTENLYSGVFTGYNQYKANVDRFGSTLKDRAGYFGGTLQYSNNQWFTSLACAYGFHSFSTDRLDIANNQHHGNIVGHQVLSFAQVGYDWFSDDQKLKITPFAGMAYSLLSFGGFSEESDSVTRLHFKKNTAESLQTTIGFEASRHIETPLGSIRPYVSSAWWHTFSDEQDYSVSLATGGLLPGFKVTSVPSNEDRAAISAGFHLSLDKAEHWVMTIGYQGLIGTEGYQSHTGTAGIRCGF
ncbi:MAG: autotransporter outer membrane beta-barrel domain-containing protein [Verrucomicrobiota bacterium]